MVGALWVAAREQERLIESGAS